MAGKVLRATFEAVFAAQERIRKHFDFLIKEDRPIKDEEERELFFKELCYATLGHGHDLIVELRHPDVNGVFFRKDIETVLRWMAYQTGDAVLVPLQLHGEHQEMKEKMPYYIVWNHLRDQLFSVFPRALEHSVTMSREQDGQRKPSGFEVEEDDSL